ncbi:hypothetical protein ACIBCA_20245 [Kitasatospora sp. NPDC051170]|uniref:hypothetical protein n=1 Tax=Kitasatospora sp. NPDC051170 TaxID=3364056 RepID=UPI0037A05D86
MSTPALDGHTSHLSLWRRVRDYAVPPEMIETATARRLVGDWAGACSAARVDVEFRLRDVARVHGRDLTHRVRDDLRRLAPDLLRWHLPRTAPDGLLRAGLTVPLARYPGERPLTLVVRTPPAWAEFGQRISLALWDGSPSGAPPHPHPHPSRRFRLDLHRHLWDAGRSGELALRAGRGEPAADSDPVNLRPAVDRWAAEASLLLRAEGRPAGPVVVRLGGHRRLLIDPDGDARPVEATGDVKALPLLPEAATWVPPDLDLLRCGVLGADLLHPLVAAALAPSGHPSAGTGGPGGPGGPQLPPTQRLVDCRGAVHRIAVVDGALTPLDHDPAQLRRERLLSALSGTPLPCLRAVEQAHRRPSELTDIRERLHHGDHAGALTQVEALLGARARLPEGPLRAELDAIAERRVTYGLYRNGLTAQGDSAYHRGRRPKNHRSHPRETTGR